MKSHCPARILILLLFILPVPTEAFSVRNLKPGDILPDTQEMQPLRTEGNRVVLFVRSDKEESGVFLKEMISKLKKHKDIKLIVVDTMPEGKDNPALSRDAAEAISVRDADRKLYGAVGIIVMPTALYIRADHVLNTVMTGVRPDFGLFIESNLKALEAGEVPADPYRAAEVHRNEQKVLRKLTQAFQMVSAGNYELAATIYSGILRNDAANIRAALGLGYVYILAEQYDKAVPVFEKLNAGAQSPRFKFGLHLSRYLLSGGIEDMDGLKHEFNFEPDFFMVVKISAQELEKKNDMEGASAAWRHAYRVLWKRCRRKK